MTYNPDGVFPGAGPITPDRASNEERAKRLLSDAKREPSPQRAGLLLAEAQVHATLAVLDALQGPRIDQSGR